MLARPYGPRFSSFPCYVQPKLNGVRALYQNGKFASRDEHIWGDKVLRHLTDELHQQFHSDLILDGELYVHGWRLQQINGAVAVNRSEPRDDTHKVQFHVFDVVDPTQPFSERAIYVLNEIRMRSFSHVKAVETSICHSTSDLDFYFSYFVSLGYEGIMIRPDGPYEFGKHIGRNGNLTQKRSQYLWKYKSWEDGEYVCVGVTPGEGKANIGIGALVLGGHPEKQRHIPVEQLGQILTFNVGTGFTDEERVELLSNPPIGKLVRVRYPYLSQDGIPQCPSFLAVL